MVDHSTAVVLLLYVGIGVLLFLRGTWERHQRRRSHSLDDAWVIVMGFPMVAIGVLLLFYVGIRNTIRTLCCREDRRHA